MEKLSVKVLDDYKIPDMTAVEKCLEEAVCRNQKKIIVLDDDPTGVQTVHDIFVYTNWDEDSIRKGFLDGNRLFFILTNSRGLTAEQTRKVHRDIAERIRKVSGELGRDYIVISRSDSTLRGHYPLETEILKEYLEDEGQPYDGEILVPYFKEGGRFTLGDVHYVKNGGELIPASDTEFARDKTFGYHSSDLKEYVEEKTKGRYPACEVVSISLDMLRSCDLKTIEEQLLAVQDFNKVIVNAIDEVDLKIFCVALYRAVEKGKRFMFRTAAGFVKAFAGVSTQPLLSREQMISAAKDRGGMVVVGSHTQKTTAQLECLRTLSNTEFIAFQSDLIEEPLRMEEEIRRVIKLSETFISEGKTAVVYTSRKLLCMAGDTEETMLQRSVKISEAVQRLVADLSVCPAFLVAKGGITSSDIGTKALRVQKAEVMGQIKPGIPVWKTEEESKFPSIPYVIFPGNVGEKETLREVVEILNCK